MSEEPSSPRIYVMPNLMTAGNLFCGFFAILQIFKGMQEGPTGPADHYYYAIWAIFGSCLFDLLDGRMARIKGQESPFGREFDSIADIVSFGMAPSLLVMDIVLHDFSKVGWIIAFIYLLAGAMRLARFNCMAADSNQKGSADFVGFPIPAAAGVIVSLTIFLLWLNDNDRNLGGWRYIILAIVLLTAILMMSEVAYPSFKRINFGKRQTPLRVFIVALVLLCAVLYNHIVPMVLFTSYLIYGFVRPWVSRKWRREFGDDPDLDLPSGDVIELDAETVEVRKLKDDDPDEK